MPSFEFDADKSAANAAKHGIDFAEAQALWDDPQILINRLPYPIEPRWLAIAQCRGKVWTAVLTRRGEAIRLISVRRARDNEAEGYANRS